MSRVAFLLLLIVAAQTRAPARAQDAIPLSRPPKYVELAVDPNAEFNLAEFLNTKSGQDLLKSLLEGPLKEIIANPPKDEASALKALEKYPFLKPLVEEFKNSNPNLPNGDPAQLDQALKKFGEKIQNDQELVEKLVKGFKVGPKGLNPDVKGPDGPSEPPKPIILPKLENDDSNDSLEAEFTDWLKDVLTDQERTEGFREFLKKTPELNEAFGDLVRSLQGDLAPERWRPTLPDGKWKIGSVKPPKLPFELGQLPKLPQITMPKVPTMNLRMPRLGRFSVPRLPGFNVGNAPRMPSAGGMQEWGYVAFALFGVGVAWWFLRKVTWSRRKGNPAVAAFLATLPTSIATRAELRQAFDTLAMLRLGDAARPWNHRLVAKKLGEAPEDSVAAKSLADLYEMARYTPGEEPLSAAEQDAARNALAALAGGEA